MAKKQMTLDLVKDTKNKRVYGSEVEGCPVPSVYVLKSALPDNAPAELTLTLEWEE